jgi:hypothetical protein
MFFISSILLHSDNLSAIFSILSNCDSQSPAFITNSFGSLLSNFDHSLANAISSSPTLPIHSSNFAICLLIVLIWCLVKRLSKFFCLFKASIPALIVPLILSAFNHSTISLYLADSVSLAIVAVAHTHNVEVSAHATALL